LGNIFISCEDWVLHFKTGVKQGKMKSRGKEDKMSSGLHVPYVILHQWHAVLTQGNDKQIIPVTHKM
jgi:hypothetical protein